MRSFPSFFALFLALVSALLVACQGESEASDAPVVLAAASMQEALEEAAQNWADTGHARPLLSFASSAVVARQAAEGAPADLVVTADEQWMDWMEGEHLLRPGTRRTVAGNTLVLVAPGKPESSSAEAADVLRAYSGRLAIAEPETVPAGRYAMAALTQMGLAGSFAQRIVPAENVRAALALVERGEVDLGIVYATDALASDKVRVLATFPPETHEPIRYPMAALAASNHPEAEEFATYLASPAGQAILARHGFSASR
ncbi:molybdate ABC transporter substrate-binding protein [Aurantiacibacter xanthus]|uniref:Molybdate ABC transporter substrate-binding protein n=1 Tax=Aurantiacibacter xanthus TaxID=1784712 RepID=A0A3A1P4K4_9SPHN|nr:molybdate ABC transporter substrate-binding protein [Aurantiacibacter xanthus]RIV81613.1 molybdate ABC transporter substrate-binding protein [Aurantiacibacter xanthus]